MPLTECPPVGTIVVSDDIEKVAKDWRKVKLKILDSVGSFNAEVELLENIRGANIGHRVVFSLDCLSLYKEEIKGVIADLVVVWHDFTPQDEIQSYMPRMEEFGFRFVRTYLNGRNTEYLFEATSANDLQRISMPIVKYFQWIPRLQQQR